MFARQIHLSGKIFNVFGLYAHDEPEFAEWEVGELANDGEEGAGDEAMQEEDGEP